MAGALMSFFAGSFLVARHVLQDPNFRQSVVLLLQHGAEGAFGLVINRPAKSKGAPFPVFNGGPCKAQGLLMLHGHADWTNDVPGNAAPGVAPGVFMGDAACLKRASEAADEPVRFRVFSGYAGWGPGQLEGELASGAWTIVPASAQLVFDTPVEELWESLVPPRLPQPSVN
jgi:putative transcriptional regulator